MAFLYLLSESDNDHAFYEACVERLTGKTVECIHLKLRLGSGIAEWRTISCLMLQHIMHTGYVEETFFLIALDNDRSPGFRRRRGKRVAVIARSMLSFRAFSENEINGRFQALWPCR